MALSHGYYLVSWLERIEHEVRDVSEVTHIVGDNLQPMLQGSCRDDEVERSPPWILALRLNSERISAHRRAMAGDTGNIGMPPTKRSRL